RGDRKAAVPHDDRRDAMPGRRARGRIPEELAVVVGVDVDETRREREPRAVDLARAALGDATEAGDPAARHGEVAADRLLAAAVTEERAPDDDIGHRGLLAGSAAA